MIEHSQTIHRDYIEVDKRQRQTLDKSDIEGLAESIHKFGLLQPPVMAPGSEEGKLKLIAGFTRLQAMVSLGWEEIPYTLIDEMDEIVRQEVELEENIRRKNLEWWEESEAIAKIHTMRQMRDPTWNVRQTAALVGKSTGSVSQAMQLNEEVKINPTIREEKTLTGALKKLDVQKKLAKKKADIERKSKGLLPSLQATIKIGDAADLIKQEPDESFDAVITNLPFGVDLEFKSGHIPYEDEEQYIIDLVQTVVEESYRVLKDDSWMVAWFDVRKITYSNHQLALYKKLMLSGKLSDEEKKLLYDSMGLTYWMEQAGFSYVNLVPAFWVKRNKTQGRIGDPRKGLIIATEAMVFAAKGGAFLMKQGRNNVFVYDSLTSGERDYSMQMPVGLCTEIVKMVTLAGARVLDPFAGSASIGLGALENQCEFVGYELNPEAAAIGNMLLKGHHLAEQEKKEDVER